MRQITVGRDYTKLAEVLFENTEIDVFGALKWYIGKHQITIEINGIDRTVEPEMRLMKGDILTIKDK